MKYFLTILLGLLLTTNIFSCSINNPDELDQRPIVAVSIVPQKTFVEAVCEDLVEVITIIPPGYSPENYEPSSKQVEKLNDISIYFSIGVPAEGKILSNIDNNRVVMLHEKVASVYPDLTFGSGERDPHIWLSPKRVKVMVEAIAEEMSKMDEENRDRYLSNAEKYLKELDDLNNKMSSILEDIDNRKFIVYHPAFQYLADDYNLEMYALEDEGKETTPRHLENMIDFAKGEDIKVIFYQEEIDSHQSKAFAEEINGIAIQLSPLAADYIESMTRMANVLSEVMM
ncbi:MAG: zinc ABC transporter solute-binding protein [Clostridiales bacterium]|nr:zinc ABC transporter solute-binding protein [Clostridiales bacterium]